MCHELSSNSRLPWAIDEILGEGKGGKGEVFIEAPLGGVWVSLIPLIFSLNIPYPLNCVVSYLYNTGDVMMLMTSWYLWKINVQTSSISVLWPVLLLSLLQQTVTWYKIRHAGGQAYYYSRTGTSKTKKIQTWQDKVALFSCPSAGTIISLPSSMADFVPCDRLLQKAYYCSFVLFWLFSFECNLYLMKREILWRKFTLNIPIYLFALSRIHIIFSFSIPYPYNCFSRISRIPITSNGASRRRVFYWGNVHVFIRRGLLFETCMLLLKTER